MRTEKVERNGSKLFVFRCDDWLDFEQQLTRPFNSRHSAGNATSLKEDDSRSPWSGSCSWDKAADIALRGEAALASAITKAAEGLQGEAEGSVEQYLRYEFADEGDEVDVDRFLQGEEDCMLNPVCAQRAGSRIVYIACNIVASGTEDSQTMIHRGVAALVLADVLTNSGYSVELTVCQSVREGGYSGDALLQVIPVKRSDQRLDLTRLAYAFAHPSMLRRHIFAFEERMPGFAAHIACKPGYGMPCDVEGAQELIGADIYIGRDLSPFQTIESSRQWIKSTLATLRGQTNGVSDTFNAMAA